MVPLLVTLAAMAPLVWGSLGPAYVGSLGPAYVSTVPYAVPPYHTRVDYVHRALRTPLVALPAPVAPAARVLPAPPPPPYYPPRVLPLPGRLPPALLPAPFGALPYPAPFAPFGPFGPFGPYAVPPHYAPPPFFYKR